MLNKKEKLYRSVQFDFEPNVFKDPLYININKYIKYNKYI